MTPPVGLRSHLATRRRAVFPALVAATLGLAACGGDDGSATGSADADDPRSSPLAELFGFDVSQAEQRARDLEMQQLMVECMRAEGWEYQAVDYGAPSDQYTAEFEEQMNDPEAYGEKYGYGVVRSYELQDDIGGIAFEDPNQEYVESLDPDEQETYYETLYGPSPEIGDEDEFVMPALEDQGCSGKAQLEVMGESPLNDPDMQERLNELFEDAENDPSIQQAYDDWKACMNEAEPSGDWTNPNDTANEFWNRLNELQGFEPIEDVEDSGGVIVSGTSTGGGPTEIDEADLEELRADEVATWKIDWACQQDVELTEVRREVEQRLVDDLRAEFPDLGEE